MNMPLARAVLNRWPILAALASAAMLATAHAFQTFGGLAPCNLCLKQREVYWAALGVAVAGLAVTAVIRRPWARRVLCLLLGLIFLVGAGLAAYHAGVEWHWWPGPTTCTGGAAGISASAMQDLLSGKPVRAPSCDQAAWVWLGLSMAGWNSVVSLGLAALSGGALMRNARDG